MDEAARVSCTGGPTSKSGPRIRLMYSSNEMRPAQHMIRRLSEQQALGGAPLPFASNSVMKFVTSAGSGARPNWTASSCSISGPSSTPLPLTLRADVTQTQQANQQGSYSSVTKSLLYIAYSALLMFTILFGEFKRENYRSIGTTLPRSSLTKIQATTLQFCVH